MIHGLGALSPEDEQPIRSVRLWDCGVTWRHLNPVKGQWVWGRLDALVRPDHSYLYVFGATPQWAARVKDDPHAAAWLGPGSNSPPANMQHWDEYVRRVVKRYEGRIKFYQVWNEPQLKDFWAPDTYGTLALMARRAYDIIKKEDPKARVVAPPILPRPSSGGVQRGTNVWLQFKWFDWPCDVYAIHCYPEQGHGAERVSWMISKAKDALGAIKAPERPLWITEINYNLLHGELPMDEQLSLLSRTDEICRKQRVSRCYWYAYEHGDPKVLGIPFKGEGLTVRKLHQLNS